MRQFFLGILIFALSVGTSPESVMRLSPRTDSADARGHGGGGGRARAGGGGHRGGYSSAPRSRPSGARTRPSTGTRPHSGSRPSTSTRPSTGTKPATRPSAKPNKPPAINPGRPATAQRPSTRPTAGARPPGARPGGSRPPGSRPAGSRPPGARPPGHRPPGTRPPIAGRPPGYRPPGYRPPAYRPPYYAPPYYRPPHYRYGPYYYNPGWGWFFTAAIVGSTLVYATSLPSDQDCQKVTEDGETLYLCDGVLYRSTYYEDEKVYEIVSDPPAAEGQPQSVVGMGMTDPMTRGDTVRELQNRLVGAGYDVGGVDGVFGGGTETAVMWLQYDNKLDSSGVIDPPTAQLLGYDVPGAADPAAAPATQEAPPAESPVVPLATPAAKPDEPSSDTELDEPPAEPQD